jgi:hypothetical protein
VHSVTVRDVSGHYIPEPPHWPYAVCATGTATVAPAAADRMKADVFILVLADECNENVRSD